jgi:hypothetical protein
MPNIEKYLTRISKNTKKNNKRNKKDWYQVGRYLTKGGRIKKLHNMNKVGARRTYQYYRIGKGDWEGPTQRKFSKMNAEKFSEVLRRREQLKGGTLLEFSSSSTNTADDIQEEVSCDNRSNDTHEEHVISAPQDREPGIQDEIYLQNVSAEEFLQVWDAWEYNDLQLTDDSRQIIADS